MKSTWIIKIYKLYKNTISVVITMNEQTILKYFPNAIEGHKLTADAADLLMKKYQLAPKNTLFGYSTCPDEINRNVTKFSLYYGGHQFPLGGLTGYPFRGKTGFAAFSHHAPDNGNILILYGPHVGISESGELGKVLRKNQSNESAACGAAIAFLNKYNAAKKNGKTYEPNYDILDMEQYAIEKMLMPHAEKIANSQAPVKELVDVNYQIIDESIMKIIENLKHHFKGKIALIGGIMINAQPNGYFEMRRFGVHYKDKVENIKI